MGSPAEKMTTLESWDNQSSEAPEVAEKQQDGQEPQEAKEEQKRSLFEKMKALCGTMKDWLMEKFPNQSAQIDTETSIEIPGVPEGWKVVSPDDELSPEEYEAAMAALEQARVDAGGVIQKLELVTQAVNDIKDPEAKEAAKEHLSLAERMTQEVFVKITDNLGSNEGGWYEDQESGEKMYVKFYKNPDQARAEFVANAIYNKLGIRAVESQMFDFNGRLAIASQEIPGAASASRDEQKGSDDIRSGFVADAYLANWDVVGLVFDNIVKGKDGHMYRIDNGGSLVFRAQGGPKEFSPDNIGELETLLKPSRPAGQVFEGMTEDDMRAQAAHLYETLTEEVIDEIMVGSGLSDEMSITVRAGLMGRREWLAKRFNLDIAQPTKEIEERIKGGERVAKAIDKMKEGENRVESETTYFPRTAFLADKDSIVNQQVDVIKSRRGYEVRFKLTKRATAELLSHLEIEREKREEGAAFDLRVSDGEMKYDDGSTRFILSNSYDILIGGIGGIRIQVSTGQKLHDYRNVGRVDVRSAKGLVRILAPENMSPGELSEKTDDVMRRILKIEGGAEPPEQGDERTLKEAMYKWHHKTESAPDDIEKRLRREEVFPGHFAMVEPGKHREYAKQSEFAVYHTLNTGGAKSILRLLKARGLMSTHERFSRGVIRNGLSSEEDLIKGGADSVFTRTVTREGLKSSGRDKELIASYTLVMDNSVMDRTDWYAYDNDRYGSTDPGTFSDRQSPDQLFEEQKKNGYYDNNEQMFRRGIDMSKIRRLAVYEEQYRKDTINELREAGITEINGEPVEKFVVTINHTSNLIELAHGREPKDLSFMMSQTFMGKEIEVKYDRVKFSYVVRVDGSLSESKLLGKPFEMLAKDKVQAEEMYRKLEEFMAEMAREEWRMNEALRAGQIGAVAKAYIPENVKDRRIKEFETKMKLEYPQ